MTRFYRAQLSCLNVDQIFFKKYIAFNKTIEAVKGLSCYIE